MSTIFGTALVHARYLEELKVGSMFLDTQFAGTILSLPTLHTLVLADCDWSIDDPSALPTSTSLLNLSVANLLPMSARTALGSLLPRMPSLRYLASSGPLSASRVVVTEPPDVMEASSSILRSVERISISMFRLDEVDVLVDWLLSTSAIHPPVVLTHFKLNSLNGVFEMHCRDIIGALRDAPLRYLHLEGIRYAAPELIDLIANTFPDLLELTLIYRDSNRQLFQGPSYWPLPAQEYAPRFAGFKRLASFSFNYRLSHIQYSPVIMRSFEEGFSQSEVVNFVYEEEWKSMFHMFAAYVPSLETLDLVLNTVFHRREDGFVWVNHYPGDRLAPVDEEPCFSPIRAWESLPMFVPYRSPRFTALTSNSD